MDIHFQFDIIGGETWRQEHQVELQCVSDVSKRGCYYKAVSLTSGCKMGEMLVGLGIQQFLIVSVCSDMRTWFWRRENSFSFIVSVVFSIEVGFIRCLVRRFCPGYNSLVYRVRDEPSFFHKEHLKCVFRLNAFEIPLLPQQKSWLGKQNDKGTTQQLGGAQVWLKSM